MDVNRKPTIALSDDERFPIIKDRTHLNNLRQDEFAPNFNFRSGDRLQEHHLQKVRDYAATLTKKTFWTKDTPPDWMSDYLTWCVKTVPFYRNRSTLLKEQPTINRNDLKTLPWSFVSTDCNLDDLLVYQTSGTTGPAMDVVFDPVSQACFLPQLESVLSRYDIRLSRGNKITSIALVCNQESTLTYASLSSYLDGAGILKINLNINDWKHPEDRIKYLEKYNPEILTGDPFAFLSLLELQPKITPRALVSSAMKLTNGIRKKLEAYFHCPVLDIYSMTECRMIAVAEDEHRHRAIRPDLYLEVFHKEHDIPLPPGERGELVITGGNNPFLPLIRYRTGDFCSLAVENGVPYLLDLEARDPVMFCNHENKFINYIDISRALMDFPLAGFNLQQRADKSLVFTGWSLDKELNALVLQSLRRIFGSAIAIEVVIMPPDGKGMKPVSYETSL